jgi:DNA-binding transcriptional MerR regulator
MIKIDNFSQFWDLRKDELSLRDSIMTYSDNINIRSLQLKEIGITSKLLNDWIEAKLVNKVDVVDNKWRLFSLSEAIWIKFVEELRYFGTPLSEIAALKSNIYDFNPEFLKEIVGELNKVSNDNKLFNDFRDEANVHIRKSNVELFKEYEMINISMFDWILIYTMIFDLDFVFLFNRTYGGFLELSGKINKELGLNNIQNIYPEIMSDSFALIKMKSIYKKFFNNEKIKQGGEFYLGIVTKKERELLEYVKSGDYSSINIKIDGGMINLLRVTKKDGNKLMAEIGRIIKKGDYKEITFLTRDGRIVRYDEVDIIK